MCGIAYFNTDQDCHRQDMEHGYCNDFIHLNDSNIYSPPLCLAVLCWDLTGRKHANIRLLANEFGHDGMVALIRMVEPQEIKKHAFPGARMRDSFIQAMEPALKDSFFTAKMAYSFEAPTWRGVFGSKGVTE